MCMLVVMLLSCLLWFEYVIVPVVAYVVDAVADDTDVVASSVNDVVTVIVVVVVVSDVDVVCVGTLVIYCY